MKKHDTAVRNIYYHCLEYDHDQLGDLFLVACGMEDCDPGAVNGPEERDCYHLHAVRSGCGTLNVHGMEFTIREGQMFLLKDGEVVRYAADEQDPWSYCWVTFNGSDARRLSEDIGFAENVYVRDIDISAEAFFDLIRRMHRHPEMNAVNDLYRKGVLMEFLALAMDACGGGALSEQRKRSRNVDDYIDRAADFIHYNYRTIDVGDVVNFIGFSRGYFTTAFRKRKGMSVQEYLLKVRMQRAKELLAGTNLQIQEIGKMAGYEDQLNFSRIFRKYEGISPSEYRRRKDEH